MVYFLLLLLCPLYCSSMGTTFTLPLPLYKTRFATPQLQTYSWQLLQTKATKAASCLGQEVPLLDFAGPQDLLYRLVNPELSCQNSTSAGTALLSGKLSGLTNLLQAQINLKNNIFFQGKAAFSQYSLGRTKLHPLDNQGHCMTAQEIANDQKLSDYLPSFYQHVFHPGQKFYKNLCNVLCFSCGWAKNWQYFEHADFINLSLQTGIQLPSINLDDNTAKASFQIPLYSYHNIGIPLQADFEFGFLNWLNLGIEGLATFFIDADHTLLLNPTATNDALFPCSCIQTKVHTDPFVYAHAYLQAEELITQTSILCGIACAKQYATSYTPTNTKTYNPKTITAHNLTQPWMRVTFNLEIQYDFTKDASWSNSPRITFLYIQPLYQQRTYQTRLLGGEFALDICAQF